MKTTFITALLLLATISGAVAQEKWEYAVVLHNQASSSINVSINGQTFEEQKVDKKEMKALGDRSALLKKVNEMMDKGWEVFQFSDYGWSVYLRKKKQ